MKKSTEVTHSVTMPFAVTWPPLLDLKPVAEVQISKQVVARVYQTKKWIERHRDGKLESIEAEAFKVTFTSNKTGRCPRILEDLRDYREEGLLNWLAVRLHLDRAIALLTPRSKSERCEVDPED